MVYTPRCLTLIPVKSSLHAIKPSHTSNHRLLYTRSTTPQTMAPASVDTTLHSSASGRALTLSNKHTDTQALKLYSGWFCPFVQRAWITLQEKRIPYQYIEVNPYHKEPDFLALNPRGLVPTLAVPVHKETGTSRKALYESTVICAYLDEVYSDVSQHGAPLLPIDDAYERARARIWIDHIGSRIVPAFYRFLQHTPEKDFSIEDARKDLIGAIKTFVKECDETGPFFLGEQFSMVDIMLAPWAMRLFLIQHYKPGGLGFYCGVNEMNGNAKDETNGKTEDNEEDTKIWKRWKVWFDAVKERESVKDTWSDDDRYIEAYQRYAEDKTMSHVGQATRKGRGLP